MDPLWLVCLLAISLSSALNPRWSFRRSKNFPWPKKPIIETIPHPLPLHSNATSSAEIQRSIDAHFMRMAMQEANKAMQRGEVPIGAVVVRRIQEEDASSSSEEQIIYEVLSKDFNRVEASRDASAHAELLALRQATHRNGAASWRLLNATLYTTLEPCPMCLAAAQAFRVQRIAYGAPDLRIGAIHTYLNLLEVPHPYHNIQEVEKGIHEEEIAELMRSFFRQQRNKGKHQCHLVPRRPLMRRLLARIRKGD